MTARPTEYWALFKPKACSAALAAREKEEALAEIVARLVAGRSLGKVLAPAALEALCERERTASTGVGMGVAIPHVALAGLERAAVSVSVHREGLDWKAIDGAPVHLVFTVLRPERAGQSHDPEQHLSLMRWISRLGRDKDFRRFAVSIASSDDLVALLRERGGP